MSRLVIHGSDPAEQLADAIYLAAETLGIWEVWAYEGRYHFALGSGWSLALSLDSADRICVETCRLTRVVSRMWTFPHRRDRLAGLVRKMSTVPETV